MQFIPCLVSVYLLMFWKSRIVPLINVMEIFLDPAYPSFLLKFTIGSGFTIGPRISMHREKFALYFLKGITGMGMKFISLLFIKTPQTNTTILFQSNCSSSILITSGTLVAYPDRRLIQRSLSPLSYGGDDKQIHIMNTSSGLSQLVLDQSFTSSDN